MLHIESDETFTTRALEILNGPAGTRLFHVKVVSTLREAFQEINRQSPDLILMDMDPISDPDFTLFNRLHLEAPNIAIVPIFHDHHKISAIKIMHKEAAAYLLESQLTKDNLPTFLLRTIQKNEAEKMMKKREEQFRLMIEHSSDVILTLASTGRINYTGPSTERILGFHSKDMAEKNVLDFIHRDDRRLFLDSFEKAFENLRPIPAFQFRFRNKEGQWIHMESQGRVVKDSNKNRVCILNAHDISHRVLLEEKLRTLSLHDELTGLHNRRSFVLFFDQHRKSAPRFEKQQVHLLFIDLDKFKTINDTYGHKEGDKVLVGAAQILKNTFRQADIISRLGGDEFVVLLTDNVEQKDVESLKQRLFDGISDWNKQKNKEYQLSMSVGTVSHDLKTPCSVDDLLNKADTLMYQSKRNKKMAQ